MAKKSTAKMESASARAFRFALVGLMAGLAGGLGIGGVIYMATGQLILAPILGFPIGGFVGGFLISLVLQEGFGGLVERAVQGSRGTSKSEYSAAQALVTRGAYKEAARVYRQAAEENPRDPEPLLQGARVLRDHLKDPAGAAEWLRRAQRTAGLTKQHEISIARELVDLYAFQLGQPERALPELARIAEKYAGTQAGTWASNRMAAIRSGVWQDVKDETPAPADDVTDYQARILGRQRPEGPR